MYVCGYVANTSDKSSLSHWGAPKEENKLIITYHRPPLPLVSLGPRYSFPDRLFCYPFHLVSLIKDFTVMRHRRKRRINWANTDLQDNNARNKIDINIYALF